MMENFKDDIKTIIKKLKENRVNNDVRKYHTLSNSLKGVIQILSRKHIDEDSLEFLSEIKVVLDKEINELSKVRTEYLNNGMFKEYHTSIKSFRDLSYSSMVLDQLCRKSMK